MDTKELYWAYLIEHWGIQCTADLEKAVNARPQPHTMTTQDFLHHCTACGGNWGGMLLTGIKELWPKVWDVIPDNMGDNAFACLLAVLGVCGVDFN